MALRREPGALRTALFSWEPIPLRPDVQRVAADLATLAQVELSAEPGVEWVERDQLDRLLAETELATAGLLDLRASLRVGKLARAQLLVTGRLDAKDHARTRLELDIIDLARGDLLASSVTPLPVRPHKHYSLRDEDRAVAVAALRSLLGEATTRQHALAAKPALALLFLANSGPNSRLDSPGEGLADHLRESADAAGARVLRFPRVRDAAEENDLVVLGLAEADDQAWRGVADLYAWGEYREIPVDGLPFEQTPVEASLTLWDGASAPRTIPWRGTVATFHEAKSVFASALRPALRKTSATDPAARAAASKLLAERANALDALHRSSFSDRDFWASELGRNFQAHRVSLLQTAAFLDPGSRAVREQLDAARWARGHSEIVKSSPERLWLRYRDLLGLEAFAPAESHTRAMYFDSRVETLQQLIQILGNHVSGESRASGQDQLARAARLWARDLKAYAAALPSTGRSSATHDAALSNRLNAVVGAGRDVPPLIDSRKVGAGVILTMIDEAWPALAPAFVGLHRDKPETAEMVAGRILRIYQFVGREDFAYKRLLAALEAADAAPSALSTASAPVSDRELGALLDEFLARHAPPLKSHATRLSTSGTTRTADLNIDAPAGTSPADCTELEKSLRAALLAPPFAFTSVKVKVSSPSAITATRPDPPPVAPDWSRPVAAAPPANDLDRPLPLSPRPLHLWFYEGLDRAKLETRSYYQWPRDGNFRHPTPFVCSARTAPIFGSTARRFRGR